MLAGRVVLVTGSSRGIGAEIAAKAASEGATVAIHYLASEDGAKRTVEAKGPLKAIEEPMVMSLADTPSSA